MHIKASAHNNEHIQTNNLRKQPTIPDATSDFPWK